MVNILLKSFFSFLLLFSFVYAQGEPKENIVDIVDFRFDKIRDNINSDITKLNSELKVVKLQDVELKSSLKELDDKLSKNIAQNKAFEKEFASDVKKYDEIIVSQDKKIEGIGSSLNSWVMGLLFVVALLVLVTSFIVRKYIAKVKEETISEVDLMVNKWMQKKNEEFEKKEEQYVLEKDELNSKVKYWMDRFKELEEDDSEFLEEFKNWTKTIDDKKVKTKVKKYIKQFKRENELKMKAA